jgi:hypothetical protein
MLELRLLDLLSDSYNLSILKATVNCACIATFVKINWTSFYATILEETLCPHQTWNNIFEHQNCRISI